METKRCPSCGKPPESKPEKENKAIVLLCPKCGHMAMGDDQTAATYHWNMYVTFMAASR